MDPIVAVQHFAGARRTVKLAASAVAICGATLVPCVAGASAASASPSTAIVTPLLTLFEFGDTVGIPEGCNTSLSVLETVASQAGGLQGLSPLLSAIGAQCQALADQVAPLIQEGLAASQSAGALNALFNPLIADLSNLVGSFGSAPGIAESPFGPTIQGLGQTITFFEGS